MDFMNEVFEIRFRDTARNRSPEFCDFLNVAKERTLELLNAGELVIGISYFSDYKKAYVEGSRSLRSRFGIRIFTADLLLRLTNEIIPEFREKCRRDLEKHQELRAIGKQIICSELDCEFEADGKLRYGSNDTIVSPLNREGISVYFETKNPENLCYEHLWDKSTGEPHEIEIVGVHSHCD